MPTDLEVSAKGGQIEGKSTWSGVGDGGFMGGHFAVRMPNRVGEVSVVGRMRLGDQVREMESVLDVKPRGNLASGGCAAHVVRDELLQDGQRFLLDWPAMVPIPYAMRVDRAVIAHHGVRASIIGRPSMRFGGRAARTD